MRGSQKRESGIALVTTLILVSAVALIVVSFFAITASQSETSQLTNATIRAEMAESAALEDAKALLAHLTANDGYLVTQELREVAGKPQRYTFITVPGATELTHFPLVTGAEPVSRDMPAINAMPTSELAIASPSPPSVEWGSAQKTSEIESYGLTHLDESGNILIEDRRPQAGLIEMPAPPSGFTRARYAYWIEDLEGFPAIDQGQLWTNHFLDSDGNSRGDNIPLGYTLGDSRLDDASSSEGLRIEDSAGQGFQFPNEFRSQRLVGQVAPGLSAREFPFLIWEAGELSVSQHPYSEAARFAHLPHQWLSGLRPGTQSISRSFETRFSFARRDYLDRPLIPYGHDYPDEGRPRRNLNAYAADKDFSLVEFIESNLPNFEQRRGGLPEPEDYVATLVANAYDYADEDSLATLPEPGTSSADYIFRGVDNYLPINELYIDFRFHDFVSMGATGRVILRARLYAEFWNPFDREAFAGDSLEFELIETPQIKINSVDIPFDGRPEVVEARSGSNTRLSIGTSAADRVVAPNEYKVIELDGQLEWTVENVPNNPILGEPRISEFVNSGRGSTVRFTYRQLRDQDLIDSLGRSGLITADGRPFYGGNFRRVRSRGGDGAIRVGEMIQMASYHSNTFVEGKNPATGDLNGDGCLFGDAWMNYYARADFKDLTYNGRTSPGSRHFNREQSQIAYKREVRVRAWPDRGYDNPVGRPPSNNEENPILVAADQPATFPRRAPWRISNRRRFFSITELGHLHDPIMWTTVPESILRSGNSHLFANYEESHLRSLRPDALPSDSWGGGNTLRIGRPEHQLFDEMAPGMRASQLLDLLHVGINGSNLTSADSPNDQALYRHFDPRDHQPPPTARDEATANDSSRPSNQLYPPTHHAESQFADASGKLNLNTAPTIFEIETFLRQPFVASDILVERDDPETPEYTNPVEAEIPGNGLIAEKIPLIARGLYDARPFYSPSHLARVYTQLIRQHEALPEHHNDAEAEETFARLFNLTHLKSRHFRIFTYGEIYHHTSGEVLGRRRRVYEVFAKPIRDESGDIVRIAIEISSSRPL